METREYKVYKFDELTEEQQTRVLEKYRDWNVENSDWWDAFPDMLTEDLNKYGLSYTSLSFSGFCSQGDGASVEYGVSDKFKFVRHLLGDDCKRLIDRIEKWCPDAIDCDSRTMPVRGYGNYSKYAYVEFYSGYPGNVSKHLDALLDRLNKASEAFHIDRCSDLYRDLEKEYDHLTSDECLTEYFSESDYLFTEDGCID